MRRRLSWVWSCVLAAGCWSSEPRVLDTFTADQLERLRERLRLPELAEEDLCAIPGQGTYSAATCDRIAAFGKQLFFERKLSKDSQVACASCHDTEHGFADTRAENNVSHGATGWTKRNASATTSAVFKELVANGAPAFGLIGGYAPATGPTDFVLASDVFDLALDKAMGSTPNDLRETLMMDPALRSPYESVFGTIEMQSTTAVVQNVKNAFEIYLRRQRTRPSKLDLFLEGDRTALDESQQRGFVIFATRGMCLECHSGPMLTDFQFHVTGVPQVGAHVDPLPISKEKGRFEVTNDPADLGRFLTPSLRDISRTGPYMHDGVFVTLGDVIAFYNEGGGTHDFLGDKDPRLEPLGLDGSEQRDLEAFLRALDGTPEDPYPANWCPTPGETRCGNACVNLQTDENNCRACGSTCSQDFECIAGDCVYMPPQLPGGM